MTLFQRRQFLSKCLLPFCLAIACALLCAGCASSRSSSSESPLTGVHRIVILGDSITYSGQWVDDFELALRSRPGAQPIEIIDLGLPSETVSGLSEPGHAGGQFPRPDLHERLARVLEQTKPDLVIACYGMNDGIYYPFGEDRLQSFKDGINWLHRQVTASGARIIHMTPSTFDPFPIKGNTLPAGLAEYRKPYEGYNQVMDQYSTWLMSRRADGWFVVDAHTPMNEFLANQRRSNPSFALSRDGVHINDTGHQIMATQMIAALHLPTPAGWDIASDTPPGPRQTELLKLIHEKNRTLSDAWLTNIGHKRPGMNHGLPLDQAQSRAADLNRKIDEKLTEIK